MRRLRSDTEERHWQLWAEAAVMWREAYGSQLSDDECDEFTKRTLNFFGVNLPVPSQRLRPYPLIVPETSKQAKESA